MTTKFLNQLKSICRLIRYFILLSTTEAGSGHPSSCLSAVELMAGLFFAGKFRYDLENPGYPNNDRLILSKGHAAPLLYALYAAAGVLDESDLKSLRKFGSILEGHPTPHFPHVEVATGSLGQGLSVGVGMALNAKYLDKLGYKTFVLLGDSEMAEGAIWEAMQIASHYKLDNLIGIIDVNRLGQSGETMYGHDLMAYEKRVSSFGWKALTIAGHDLSEVLEAYDQALKTKGCPTMIIAKTSKGKGVRLMEDKLGWHGKTLSKDQFREAEKDLGKIDKNLVGSILKPIKQHPRLAEAFPAKDLSTLPAYEFGQKVATRKAYGTGLVKLATQLPKVVALDAEVKYSTYAQTFEEYFPKRFFEMFIAEQNLVSVALGLSKRGKIPFVSTFAAFFTRAFDQIRMASYSGANIKFVGSHVGVSVGEDGPSQMGLEDLSLFRSIHGSIVLYPADAISCEKLVEAAAKTHGLIYIRTTRKDTPIIYGQDEQFPIGGSKVIRKSSKDLVSIVAAGITLFEALQAYDQLKQEGIWVRVIDLYSVKPLDKVTLLEALKQTQAILVVEDHHPEGGIAEAVRSALHDQPAQIHSLSVRKEEMSGTPEELLDYEDIAGVDIIAKLRKLLSGREKGDLWD